MTPSVGRALNLTAHAYGRATRRREDQAWLRSVDAGRADRILASVLVSELGLTTAGALVVAFPLIMLSKALGGSVLSVAVDFVTYVVVSAPVAAGFCIAFWNLFTPRGAGRRRRRPYLMPRYEDRYQYPPFITITMISWIIATVVAASIVANSVL